MASPHTHSLSAVAAVVEPFPIRPAVSTQSAAGARRIPQADIEGLVTALLDLCNGYEASLRTVIAMQRNLERVRRCQDVSPEAALLVQEITRQLQGLADGRADLGDRLSAAALHLDTVRGSCEPER